MFLKPVHIDTWQHRVFIQYNCYYFVINITIKCSYNHRFLLKRARLSLCCVHTNLIISLISSTTLSNFFYDVLHWYHHAKLKCQRYYLVKNSHSFDHPNWVSCCMYLYTYSTKYFCDRIQNALSEIILSTVLTHDMVWNLIINFA